MNMLEKVDHAFSKDMGNNNKLSTSGKMRLISKKLLARKSYSQKGKRITGLPISQKEQNVFI